MEGTTLLLRDLTAAGNRIPRYLLLSAGLAILVIVLIRTAWVSDDAYITFRCIDQWHHGNGPVWNARERVQPFTHPLWFLLLSAVTLVVQDPYFAAIVVSILCTLIVAALAASRSPRLSVGLFAMAALLASKAFIDYSTSGLENPLTNLLIAVFLIVWWRAPAGQERDARSALVLTSIASLILTNRMDVGLIVLPPLAVRLMKLPWRSAIRVAVVGMLPFLLWEVFAVVYYGFPFPNTAYAKLSTGIPHPELVAQGMRYVRESLRSDPVTLPLIATAVIVGVAGRVPATWSLSIGLTLYIVYVVRVGGDFMSGRFFVTPFVAALFLLVRTASRLPATVAVAATCVVVAAGLQAPKVAALSGSEYDVPESAGAGIQDERGYYYHITGLRRPNHPWQSPVPMPARSVPPDVWPGHSVAVQDAIGIYGYQTGRSIHIIDVMGLADPLLARLPCQRPWRIGHFLRFPPEGYLETLESGQNHLKDPRLAAFYDKLSIVIHGPIWSGPRLAAIVAFNLGRYDHLLPSAGP